MKTLFEFVTSLKIAFAALKANKARGTLTTLGIIIGIVAVVTTMTAANGLENSFKDAISAIGSDVLYVTRMPWIITENFFEYRKRKSLTLKDAQKLEKQLTGVIAVNPLTGTSKHVKYKSDTFEDIRIIGTTDKYVTMSSTLPEEGRFLLPADVHARRSVCVIGSEIKEKVFKDSDPINKRIKVGRNYYRVVGVLEKQGGGGFFGSISNDSRIIVPITSFIKGFGGKNRDVTIAVKLESQEDMTEYEHEIMGEMRRIRKLKPTDKDNFSINKMDSFITLYNSVMGVIVLIGLMITSISLFVGGIGVMNVMFVSVTERTKEIGIRKAIGAKKRNILMQFLFESSMICLLGGLIGLICAYGIAALINAFLMPATLSIPIVITAITISIFVGIISGIIPAYKAAKLDPIDALRYE